jgi:hypothetical protein
MALRPVSDSAKQDLDGDADPSELDAVAKLISEDSGLETRPPGPPLTMIERARPDESAPKYTVAGWYPDDADPTLQRYWDGHHLTGQTMRTDTGAAHGTEVTRAPTPTPKDDAAEAPARPLGTWTSLRADGGSSPSGGRSPQPGGTAPGGTAPDSPAREKTPPREATTEAPAAAGGLTPADLPEAWADKAARAVAGARTAGTPEAWREVVSVVAVLSELAQTMVVAASASQVSEQADRTADKARHDAKAAKDAAVAANEASQRAADRAQQAEDAAKAAARAAADAKQAAQLAEQEAPELAERAETATRTAADAKATFKGIEGIVADAVAADTPDAWAEAHRLAAAALDA